MKNIDFKKLKSSCLKWKLSLSCNAYTYRFSMLSKLYLTVTVVTSSLNFIGHLHLNISLYV